LLYAVAFQKWDFSVHQFKRLLSYGHAKWETFAPGKSIFPKGQNNRLRVIVQGGCNIYDDKHKKLASVGVGSFLGVVNYLGGNGPCGSYSSAFQTTTVVTWDNELLNEELGWDEDLRLKINGALTISMADRVLSVKEFSCSKEVQHEFPAQKIHVGVEP